MNQNKKTGDVSKFNIYEKIGMFSLVVISLVLSFSLSLVSAATNISVCQGTVNAGDYVLNASLSRLTDANCLVFDNNVSLDCKGYSISMSTAGGYAAIHASNKNNTVLKNCNIINASYGYLGDRGTNVTLINNTFNLTSVVATTRIALTAFGGSYWFENNTFIDGNYHIYAVAYSGIATTPSYMLRGNVFRNATGGVLFNDAGGVAVIRDTVIERNNITSGTPNNAVIYIITPNGNNLTVRNNNFYFNNTGTAHPFWTKNMSNIVFDNNNFGSSTFKGWASSTTMQVLFAGGENITVRNNTLYSMTYGGIQASTQNSTGMKELKNVYMDNNTVSITGNFSWGFGCGADVIQLLNKVNNCTFTNNKVYATQRLNTAMHGFVMVYVNDVYVANNYVNGSYQGAVIKGINNSCLVVNNQFYYAGGNNLFDKTSKNCVFRDNTLGYSLLNEAVIGNDGGDGLTAQNSTWINTKLYQTVSRYAFLVDSNSSAIVINTTFTSSNQSVCALCNLSRQWWYQGYISVDGEARSGSVIEIIQGSTNIRNVTTQDNGYTTPTPIQEYFAFNTTLKTWTSSYRTILAEYPTTEFLDFTYNLTTDQNVLSLFSFTTSIVAESEVCPNFVTSIGSLGSGIFFVIIFLGVIIAIVAVFGVVSITRNIDGGFADILSDMPTVAKIAGGAMIGLFLLIVVGFAVILGTSSLC